MNPAPPVTRMFLQSGSGANLVVPVSTGASRQMPESNRWRLAAAAAAADAASSAWWWWRLDSGAGVGCEEGALRLLLVPGAIIIIFCNCFAAGDTLLDVRVCTGGPSPILPYQVPGKDSGKINGARPKWRSRPEQRRQTALNVINERQEERGEGGE